MRLQVRRIASAALLAGLPGLAGCVTVAEFRKLEHEVAVLREARGPAGRDTQRAADLSLEVEQLRENLAQLEGRVDVAEHQAREALTEARNAREQAVGGGASAPAAAGPDAAALGAPPAPGAGAPGSDVQAYREAYAAWRAGDNQACIDRFQQFLQTYPSSSYADDAGFWMADCYFKQGDYRAAILRFDDVASGHPTGDKAADALYRQGEALMRLGPGYANAARRAFERVIQEYPSSPRVPEAKRQLEALGTG